MTCKANHPRRKPSCTVSLQYRRYTYVQSKPCAFKSVHKSPTPLQHIPYIPPIQTKPNTTSSHSHNPISPPRSVKARKPESQQPSGDTPKPRQIIVNDLTRDVDIHTPHAGDNVHRQDNGAHNGEFAEDVGILFRALVHADVDLGDVVAVGSAEETVG